MKSYKLVKDFVLMDVGKTQNNLVITYEMLDKSIHTFDGKPIIHNKNKELTDYRDKGKVEDYYSDKLIGVIIPDTVEMIGGTVFADVVLEEMFANKSQYDNWLIAYEDGAFTYDACELY